MSRCAMTLPMVARRSPATTTPPGKVAATIVVPCGTRSPAPADTFRWLGNTLGATRAAKSANDEVSARRKSGVNPTDDERSLTGRPSGRTSERTPPRSPPARRRSHPAGSRPLSPAPPCGCCRPVLRLRPHAPRLALPCVGFVLTRACPRSSLLSPRLTMMADSPLTHATPRFPVYGCNCDPRGLTLTLIHGVKVDVPGSKCEPALHPHRHRTLSPVGIS